MVDRLARKKGYKEHKRENIIELIRLHALHRGIKHLYKSIVTVAEAFIPKITQKLPNLGAGVL